MLDKRLDQGMTAAGKGGTYRLEEGADEEGMAGKLHGADLVLDIEAREAQAGGLEAGAVGGIRPIVALVAFVRAWPVENGVQLRPRCESDGTLLPDQRAGEGSDDQLGGWARKFVTY